MSTALDALGEAAGGAPASAPPPPSAGSTPPVADPPPANPGTNGSDPGQSGNNPGNTGNGVNWDTIRTEFAQGDPKLLDRLGRYKSLNDALKAGIEAQNKLGERVKPPVVPGKDASPEELKAYREANQIPDKPEDYPIELPEGRVLGEADKPVADNFLKIAHEHNLPPHAVNAIIAGHLALQEQAAQDLAEVDALDQVNAIKALQSEDVWGVQAKAVSNKITAMLQDAPEEVRGALLEARLPNGKMLGNDPQVMQFLGALAQQLHPQATITPNVGADTASLQTEHANLTKLSGDYNSDYWKGPKAAMMQARMKELNVKLGLASA